jgi:DNA-binding response OmpR family regulator
MLQSSSSSADLDPDQDLPRWDILIVEDDDLIREELAWRLRLEGYHVAAVGDGTEALTCLRRAAVGLVLLDLMMPGLSGWDLAAAMRREPRLAAVPIMTITAVGNAHLAPAGPVFLKPLNLESLLRGVAQHLRTASRSTARD